MLSRANVGRCRADCPICMWSHDRPTAWYRQGCREACGMRACPRNIQQSGGQAEGPKGMWAMERSVSTPPDRHSTTRTVPSPPAPERCEIWLFEWAWGELCVELSSFLSRRQASSELSFAGAAVLKKIVLDGPAVVATLRVGAASDCR